MRNACARLCLARSDAAAYSRLWSPNRLSADVVVVRTEDVTGGTSDVLPSPTGRWWTHGLSPRFSTTVTRSPAILEGAPPHLLASRASYDTTSRRIRAIAQTVAALDGRRQLEDEDFAEAERLLYRGDRR